MKKIICLVGAGMLAASAAPAKMDLVTLPARQGVQLTIYNSADLTLVRETRELTLKKGENRLQFSWANTLIDPTSLELLPKAQAGKLTISDLTYPPRVQGLGVWTIQSEVSGKVPVEVLYLTSGFSWRAFYMGTLSGDESVMRLEGYVRVTNQSGEDYEEAQTRLIVGQVHILDQIAELARRQYPYGRPGVYPVPAAAPAAEGAFAARKAKAEFAMLDKSAAMGPKEIRKEGLSEYFLYTIEGTETIPHEWSKRLPSFEAEGVPVVNLYKYEEERYGEAVVRFLSFKNDQEHKLGETPIPDGVLRVCRRAGAGGHLSYEGQSGFKYIPVGQEVELNLGAVGNVAVKPTLMDFKTENYQFDTHGDVSGWEEVRRWKLEVKNTRELPVKVEVRRNFGTPKWELEKGGEFGEYQKVDMDTVKFTLALEPRTKKEFTYTLRTFLGTRG
jgi:hypothetical protein